jgi:hypothetical protein
MTDWVPFAEGKYRVEKAFLVTPQDTAVALEKAVIDVFTGAGGRRRMRGSCPVQPLLIVEIHEEHDELDLLMDLGGAFKYVLRKPVLQAGKVFSPNVKALLHFTPTAPLEPVEAEDFDARVARLKIISA